MGKTNVHRRSSPMIKISSIHKIPSKEMSWTLHQLIFKADQTIHKLRYDRKICEKAEYYIKHQLALCIRFLTNKRKLLFAFYGTIFKEYPSWRTLQGQCIYQNKHQLQLYYKLTCRPIIEQPDICINQSFPVAQLR